MPVPKPKNRILAALPAKEWEQIGPLCQPIELVNGRELIEGGEPFTHVYFPESGIISTVSVFESGEVAEIATTGREGMVSIAAILGADHALYRSIVQMPGSALMIDIQSFRRAQREFPAFKKALLAYSQAFLGQVMQSVACNGTHSVEERCARWLLMAHDRSDGDQFFLTQEFLAQMLSVSRPAVNLVARTLQRAGLIRYRRGEIAILDRAGLEEASCECYGLIRQHYEQHQPE
jgi:CRP-like cAMP-binding protein